MKNKKNKKNNINNNEKKKKEKKKKNNNNNINNEKKMKNKKKMMNWHWGETRAFGGGVSHQIMLQYVLSEHVKELGGGGKIRNKKGPIQLCWLTTRGLRTKKSLL